MDVAKTGSGMAIFGVCGVQVAGQQWKPHVQDE
jgi:hypothetical protein